MIGFGIMKCSAFKFLNYVVQAQNKDIFSILEVDNKTAHLEIKTHTVTNCIYDKKKTINIVGGKKNKERKTDFSVKTSVGFCFMAIWIVNILYYFVCMLVKCIWIK